LPRIPTLVSSRNFNARYLGIDECTLYSELSRLERLVKFAWVVTFSSLVGEALPDLGMVTASQPCTLPLRITVAEVVGKLRKRKLG